MRWKKEEGTVKSHIFKVVIEEDAFEDGRKAYHAYCPALRGVTRGVTHQRKPA